MKRSLTFSVTALLFSAMFLTVAAYSGDGGVTKSSTGMWSGTIYQVGYCDGSTATAPIIKSINIGKGVMSLTGKSDWFGVACSYCSVPSSTPPYYCDELSGSGWGIITAANGDQIHISIISQTIDLTANPPTWDEVEETVGGTGSFEGATGETNSHGVWTFKTDPFPVGSGYDPGLLSPPQGWVGVNEGHITMQ